MSLFLRGLAAYYFIDKVFIEPNKPECRECTAYTPSNNFNLDLTDFDVLLVSPENPNIMFHVNHLDNRAEGYKTTFLNYTLDGSTLKSVNIPFDSIVWKYRANLDGTETNNNASYSISGSFNVEGKKVTFEVPGIRLGMVIRAQPNAGKYGGVTLDPSGLLTIDTTTYPVYAAVTAGFFANYPSIDMKEAGIRTHWAMYFDKDFNFYHLDLTQVNKPTPDYYSHSFLSQIHNDDKRVDYYNPIRVIGGNGIITVGYTKNLDFITKDFNQIGQTLPYRYAKMNILKEDSGGMGIYTYLDSTR
jgi:hypothetical protein